MIDWSKTAFLFPGQGSQQVGMGKAVADEFSAAKTVFEQADSVFGMPFSRLVFEGPEDELNMTYNTQPSLFVTSIAVLAALKSVYGNIQPAMVAGHSLGEITSLVVAEAIQFEDGLRLVRERARLMGVAGEKMPGAMAAILGLDVEPLRQICQQASNAVGRPVVVANDNCPGQIVISGDRAALENALERCKTAGARRVLPLAVSVAAHSPLMNESAKYFSETILAATPIHVPKLPVIGNANADFLPTPEVIRHELSIQITSSVRWTESMQKMLGQGIKTFLEIGSKSVLCGLMKRIDKEAVCIVIEKPEDIHQLATLG